ncbi:MAG: hypothetical protein J0G32_07100 [Alphaproteobacteria bacterium]|nr:hypothetical protein [Alphaproteobacteria bacterium]OJV14237.1 MAG: hypothetical protein BGO27_01910 [Alphaproteobacteria bacterium 33-17]
MPQLTVIGYPLEFTLSPKIHNIWLNKYKLPCKYLQSSLNDEQFLDFIETKKFADYLGFNVTIPYKEKILKYLDYASQEVIKTGACNTVHIKNGKLYGYNTDYIATRNKLKGIKVNNCLVVGAGGYAKAAIEALCDEIPACNIDLCNRSIKTITNANYIGNINNVAKVYDLIIIAIPRSDTYYQIIEKFQDTKVIDATYAHEDILTKNVLLSGKELLIEQARYAFEIWFNILPEKLDLALL